jgi:hypothetical protein
MKKKNAKKIKDMKSIDRKETKYEMARGAAVEMLTIKLFGIYIVMNIFVPIPFFS